MVNRSLKIIQACDIRNEYTFVGVVSLFFKVIMSKFISYNSRLIRTPIVIRGKKYIDFGYSLTTGVGCRFDAFGGIEDSKKLIFGSNVQLNDYVHIVAMNRVVIGNDVLMASHVFISDNSHGIYSGTSDDSHPNIPPRLRNYMLSEVRIGDNVWIGEGVIIMPGVSIGNGCVIGAHSVVNSDIPCNCIAVGSPAKVIKRFNDTTKRWEKVC